MIHTGFPTRDQFTERVLRRLFSSFAFEQLESAEKARLINARWSAKTIDKCSTLIEQSAERQSVQVLMSGWAFRYQTLPDGKRQILDFVFAGALLGFGSAETNSYGVETVTSCTVATMPLLQFKRLLAASPALAIKVAERVSDSEMRAHEHITSLGRRSARERIAAFIVELALQTRINDSGGCADTLQLPVTQIMIGDALGLSNEHVCRMLAKLAGDGIIELERHAVKVLDTTALAREAGFDHDVFLPHKERAALAA
jgi:CRP/FNR family transcriptional regulator, anaerobic regulatory protein